MSARLTDALAKEQQRTGGGGVTGQIGGAMGIGKAAAERQDGLQTLARAMTSSSDADPYYLYLRNAQKRASADQVGGQFDAHRRFHSQLAAYARIRQCEYDALVPDEEGKQDERTIDQSRTMATTLLWAMSG